MGEISNIVADSDGYRLRQARAETETAVEFGRSPTIRPIVRDRDNWLIGLYNRSLQNFATL